ncbi:hypothetical protein NM208_g17207 [Fusarium decemcellulare]|uniref:Uncharacterized protein n=1 Tax=Fusarium decemcellulare TaxID=57161 RepID=A0ACC1R9W1_9HYPO|nr:hypothetical protein NM208_g17207 [Fusarium decemcellulare]
MAAQGAWAHSLPVADPAEAQRQDLALMSLATLRTGDILQVEGDASMETALPAPAVIDFSWPEVQLLLKRFADHLIAHLTSLPSTRQSPWGTMNHATAVFTLAEATYLKRTNIKHANLANLYAILAMTAYYLEFKDSDECCNFKSWQDFGSVASEKAKLHLQESLRTETRGPQSAKYKEQLMALTALKSLAYITGNDKEARCYLLDAERLMRARGLAKREISHKARLLHHVYTYARVVGESTYVLHDYPALQQSLELNGLQRPRASERTDGANTRLDDFLRIGPRISEEEVEQQEHQDAQAGVQDIHLEDARGYTGNIYHVIYGIPEKWLSLVSQTTRLANFMDTVRIAGEPRGSEVDKMLHMRASRLEDTICAFVAENSATWDPNIGEYHQVGTTPTAHMFRCLNSALIIFFYRRIRDVNPWMLQSHVDDIIRGLDEYNDSLAQYNLPGPGVIWPAFMAGCEAIGGPRRDALRRWMEEGYAKCGFQTYRIAKEAMMEVWAKNDEGSSRSKQKGRGRVRTTWMDVSRQSNKWLMLY